MPSSAKPRAGILDHTGDGVGGAQFVAACMAAVLHGHFQVEMLHSGAPGRVQRLENAFGLDLQDIGERLIPRVESFQIPGSNGLGTQLRANAAQLTSGYDVFIYSGHGVPPFCHAGRGIVYCHFPIETEPSVELAQDPRWTSRNFADRAMRSAVYRWAWRRRMRGYQAVLANSDYTAKWIERLWGRSAEVVYPPVELAAPATAKTKTIISVGRFTSGRRSKLQFEQVQAFRKFNAEVPGWTLALAGSCGDARGDVAYLRSVKEAAQGLPVRFLVNENRTAVVRALAEAAVFWHTVGLGADLEREPALAEHFGIATVEAMLAGCVPIVGPWGGQKEIVVHGHSGFHFEDLEDLTVKTRQVAENPAAMERISANARLAAARFSRTRFSSEVKRVIQHSQ